MPTFQYLILTFIMFQAIIFASTAEKAESNDETETSSTTTTGGNDADTIENLEGGKTESTSPLSMSTAVIANPTINTLIDAPDLLTDSSPSPKAPEDAMFIVSLDNKICVAARIESLVSFVLPGRESASFSLPKVGDIHYDGRCRPHPMLIVDSDDGNLTIEFNKTKDEKGWKVTSMRFQYDPVKVYGDKSTETSLVTLKMKDDDIKKFTAPLSQSLVCTQVAKFYNNKGENEANIVFNTFTMQAYNVPSEFGNETPCITPTIAAKETPRRKFQSDVAPIAVGSTLAILTLAVIVGYAIYRSLTTKKVDYATME